MLKEEARALAVEDSLNKNKVQTLYRGGGTASGRSLGKIIAVLTIFLIIGMCFVGSASAFAGGDGSESNPYQIATASDLQSLTGYLSSYFILNNDIDCSSLTSWTCIGSESNPFYGNLNGNDKTIEKLTFSATADYFGIFSAMAYGGTITNCTFDNITLSTGSNKYVGIICGNVTSASSKPVTLTNVVLQNSSLSGSSSYSGGFVGYINASSYLTCNNCRCKSIKIIENSNYVGGFLGQANASSVITCDGCNVSLCNIIGKNYTGGFVGYVYSSSLSLDENCLCENSIIKSFEGVGGFVGHVITSSTVKISENASEGDGARVKNCYIYSLEAYAGGFVGRVTSLSSLCSVNGGVISGCTVIGENDVGGVFGQGGGSKGVVTNPSIINCTIIATDGTASGVVGIW